MVKSFYRKLCNVLLFIFLIFGGMRVQAAPAPANAVIGTQATLTFLDASQSQQVVLSNIVLVTVNPVNALSISPGIISSAFPGEEIAFPVKVTNKGNIDTSMLVYLANQDDLVDLKFTVDTNNNGILDDGETTVLPAGTPIDGFPTSVTPIIKSLEDLSLIVTGKVPEGAVANTVEKYAVHARILANPDVLTWNTNEFTIKPYSNVEIIKSIGETGEVGAYVYVFRITNESATPATNITLTDTLPAEVAPDLSTAVWFPIGSSVGKSIPLTATGYEDASNDVDVSVVNNILTLKLKNVPAFHNENYEGGILHLRVRPTTQLASGTVLSNTASYTYDNGNGTLVSKDTNTVTYTIPAKHLVKIDADITDNFARGALFTIPQTIENIGNIKDTYDIKLVDGTHIGNPIFYLDTNNDGIRQANETTVITETSELQPGEKYNFFLVGRWLAAAPNTDVFKISATSKAEATAIDESIINATSYNAGSNVLLAYDGTYNVTTGQEVVIPQVVINKTGISENFVLSAEETNDIFANIKFILDENNDGIRQVSETTEITNTTNIENEGTFNFFMVATLKPEIVGSKYFRIFAKANNLVGEDWSVITLNITQPVANVKIHKTLGPSGDPDAFVYVFRITNDSDVTATNIVLTDVLPDTIEPDSTEGKWFPFGEATGKNVPLTDTGYEDISADINLSVINNVMTLKLKSAAPGDGIANTGGVLHLRVRPKTSTAPGTLVTNTASYTYNNGVEVVPAENTETVNYTIPNRANVLVEKSVIDLEDSNSFVYVFKFTNDATINGTDLVLTDTLSDDIEVDGITGVWFPFGDTTGKSIPITATGYEDIANEIDLSVVNNIMTIKLKSIPAGAGTAITNGGILQLRVKAKAGVAPGTVVTNVASYDYNNGIKVVPSINTNSVNFTTPSAILTLEKYQAIDENKDNVIDAAYTKDALTANPGSTIFYKLVIKNTGNGSASNLVVNDQIAEYTTMFNGDGSISEKGKPVQRLGEEAFAEIANVPALGESGTVSATIPLINPGETVEIYYNVKVNE
ncbi:hypothetical protein [Fusobacterium sp.]|uniref:hypothetical protein n=1 Tax=Fusobacterium sp. TaxID=68766 RepID=UPI0026026FFB|nr:hypothetical protein [Fusobacterium sp.]